MRRRTVFSVLGPVLLACGVTELPAFDPVGNSVLAHDVRWAGDITSVAPVDENTVYVGTGHGGVWKTVDGGVHWEPLTDGFPSLRITSIVTGETGQYVVAATSRPARILRSTNHGGTFTVVTIPDLAYANQEIRKVLMNPAVPSVVYALGITDLYRSQDYGVTWESVYSSSFFPITDVALFKLSLSAGNNVLLSEGNSLYVSTNGDPGSFQYTLVPPPDGQSYPFPADDLLFAPNHSGSGGGIFMAHKDPGQQLYLGYQADSFGGFDTVDWLEPHASVWTFGRQATGTYDSEKTLFTVLGNLFGDVVMRQGGPIVDDWTTFELSGPEYFTGPYKAEILAIVRGPGPSLAYGRVLYVLTTAGLWRWQDTGPQEWINMNGDLGNLLVHHAQTSRGDDSAIVAATEHNGVILYDGYDWHGGALVSSDDAFLRSDLPDRGGVTVNGKVPFTQDHYREIVGDVVKAPATNAPCGRPTQGQFAVVDDDATRICVASGAVRCSSDAGATDWCTSSADIGATAVVPIDESVLWARTSDHRVMRTTTGVGGTWDDVSATLPADRVIRGLAAPQSDPQRALVLVGSATVPYQVWETTNGGADWTAVGLPPVPGRVVEPWPAPCDSINCPTLPELDPDVLSFAVQFGSQETWYVGTDHGLLLSPTQGQQWGTAIEIPRTEVREIDVFPGTVTVATYGRGVFQSTSSFEVDVPLLCELPWCYLNIPMPHWFASDVIDRGGGTIQELIQPAAGGPSEHGGRVFAAGDVPHGPTDFRLTPGTPVVGRTTRTVMLELRGEPTSLPIVLQHGWNLVGVSDPIVASSSELIADAAAQGITVETVVEPTLVEGVPGEEIPIDTTRGYWIWVCGDGGSWTPGAGLAAR